MRYVSSRFSPYDEPQNGFFDGFTWPNRAPHAKFEGSGHSGSIEPDTYVPRACGTFNCGSIRVSSDVRPPYTPVARRALSLATVLELGWATGRLTGLGVVGPLLWFPLFPHCHHEEPPLQYQTQKISRTFPSRYFIGNLHQSCCWTGQPPRSIEYWLRRWALGVVLTDLVVDSADLTVLADERNREIPQIVLQDRMREDLEIAPVARASRTVVGDAERRRNRPGKCFR